ncbi:MAG: LytR family transcriptional regulator [Chrysiogenales bacterium]|nr:MAG: LytR family transcriptional regulator [Chrysiogenales bacterium]
MKRRTLIIGAALLLVLMSVFLYRFCGMRARNAVEQLIQEKRIINILVAGSNKFRDHRHTFFAVVSINPDNRRIGITFIPPSFRIRLDDEGEKGARIDDMVVSDFDPIRTSLQKDLKLNIPFYVELYAQDVERIVDLLEGVDLFVMDSMKNDPAVGFGVNYFDGRRVVRYINSVEENSIFLKYDRILGLLMNMYKDREKYEHLIKSDLAGEIMKSMKTNLLPQEELRIAGIIFKDGDVMATVLPGIFREGFYRMDDITYRIYEKEFLELLIVDRSEKEIDSSIKIKILNGTDAPGLARKMRERLIREGMNVVEFGTSPYKKMKKSIIINRRGNIESARRVSDLTEIRNLFHVIDNTQLHNILIIIGEDMAK